MGPVHVKQFVIYNIETERYGLSAKNPASYCGGTGCGPLFTNLYRMKFLVVFLTSFKQIL
jgi:hypothetical protein